MRILLVNPTHQSIGSRIPREMLPPLGLLALGGPLIDDGHDVTLLDADVDNLSLGEVLRRIVEHKPDAILIGHTGSTSAHPTVALLVPAIRSHLPDVWIIYGGVFPTYHWKDVLKDVPDIDIIVRGEGEETCRRLMGVLAGECAPNKNCHPGAGPRDPLCPSSKPERAAGWIPPTRGGMTVGGGAEIESAVSIPGIALRRDGRPFATPPAPMIADLDGYRIGWELIDHARYSYYGGIRGVVIQFSRGCPHLCSFCGQRGFWTRWRHRDPIKLAKEIARLNREHGVKMISFADENPTTSPKIWRAFLEALIAENCDDLTMIGTVRADDIVRDADILHLYRQAGFRRFLLGMEHTDEATLQKVRKGGDTQTDRRAIQLLRQHGILSLMSCVVGFEEETDADYRRTLRQLIAYDPDQIVTLFVTPHRWTPLFKDVQNRRVVQTDQRRWDYKHQVLANRHVPPWRTFLWVKMIEVLVQARPKALRRTYLHPDPTLRHGMRWYARMGRRVWLHEVWSYLFRDRRTVHGPTVGAFWGVISDMAEEAMGRGKAVRQSTSVALGDRYDIGPNSIAPRRSVAVLTREIRNNL